MSVDWGKVKGILQGIAPTVATALGGPFAGVAAQQIVSALGAKDPASAIQMIQADPNAVLELKKAELAFLQFMADAEIRSEQLVFEDRKDARGMAVSLQSIAPQFAIVVGLTVMIGAVINELFTGEPPQGSRDVLYMLLGQLSTAWAAAIAFFVGTTQGSAKKTAMFEASRERG